MEPNFSILFMYMGLLFIGEVQRHDFEGVGVYEVYFALASNPHKPEFVEIYHGFGAKDRKHWRQRIVEFNTDLADPALITIIGEQVKIREDISSK